MDAIETLRATYLAMAAGVLFVAATPPLRDRLLAYGPRAVPFSAVSTTSSSHPPPPSSRSEKKRAAAQEKREALTKKDVSPMTEDAVNTPPSTGLAKVLDNVAAIQVSHSLFWTFYLFATTVSLFWLVQAYFTEGSYFRAIANWASPRKNSMTFEQLKLTWILFSLKNAWRFNEYMASPPSRTKTGKGSKIWIGHWFLGISFYALTSVAIWIEGIPTLINHTPSMDDLSFSFPPPVSCFSIAVFILAAGLQNDAHSYLAKLKYMKPYGEEREDEHGYKLPSHPVFSGLIAPHYTAECAMWLSIAFVAAPGDDAINYTLLCALIFVVVNLGITARGTKQWYEAKFGPESVKGKWTLIPSVY